MRQSAIMIVLFGLNSIIILGCDLVPGNGANNAPPPPVAIAPPVAPIPGAPVQPAVAPQPIPAPAQPVPAQAQPVPVPAAAPPAQPIPAAPAQPSVAATPPTPEQPPVPTPTLAEGTPVTDILADKMTMKKIEIAAAFTPTSALTKQNLKKGAEQAYQVQLPGPPFCHTFIALTAEANNNVDLSIKSPTGVADATDSTEDSIATIQDYCPTTPGSYNITVAMPKSDGEFAVQVFSK
jgi:hypothetical protein